jgi:hypothetical protein
MKEHSEKSMEEKKLLNLNLNDCKHIKVYMMEQAVDRDSQSLK